MFARNGTLRWEVSERRPIEMSLTGGAPKLNFR